MLERPSPFQKNTAQVGDALELLQSLSDASAVAMAWFDPQHRSVLNKLKFGNEGSRQRGRAGLPAMSDDFIDAIRLEIARILKPSAYCMRWIDTFGLCEGHHLRIPREFLTPVDLIAWDSLRMGMGKRSRRRGDYLLVLQRPPVTAKTWIDHGIPSRWPDSHPHAKPLGLITRLIGAVTQPGDLVVDPAAGSFIVMTAAHALKRDFIGCDIAPAAFSDRVEGGGMTLGSHQQCVGKSQIHITPKWIVDRLGPFDLDPCAADPPHRTDNHPMNRIEKLTRQLATETDRHRRRQIATQLGTCSIRAADRKTPEKKPPRDPAQPASKWCKLGDLRELLKQRR
jgi:site-specific DNA-methyltransferase (adenine-specific)